MEFFGVFFLISLGWFLMRKLGWRIRVETSLHPPKNPGFFFPLYEWNLTRFKEQETQTASPKCEPQTLNEGLDDTGTSPQIIPGIFLLLFDNTRGRFEGWERILGGRGELGLLPGCFPQPKTPQALEWDGDN